MLDACQGLNYAIINVLNVVFGFKRYDSVTKIPLVGLLVLPSVDALMFNSR